MGQDKTRWRDVNSTTFSEAFDSHQPQDRALSPWSVGVASVLHTVDEYGFVRFEDLVDDSVAAAPR
jgi:hypothetical protein